MSISKMMSALEADMYKLKDEIDKLESDRGNAWIGIDGQIRRWHLLVFLVKLDSRLRKFL